jgi:hypothetical protein
VGNLNYFAFNNYSMDERKLLNYENTLRPLVGKDAVLVVMEVKDGRGKIKKIRGKISNGGPFYRINGKEGTFNLVPGEDARLEVEDVIYKLSDLRP